MKFITNRSGYYLGGRLISTFEAKCEWMKWRQLLRQERVWEQRGEDYAERARRDKQNTNAVSTSQ